MGLVASMKILHVMIQIEDDGSIEIWDAIEYEGHLWLVQNGAHTQPKEYKNQPECYRWKG